MLNAVLALESMPGFKICHSKRILKCLFGFNKGQLNALFFCMFPALSRRKKEIQSLPREHCIKIINSFQCRTPRPQLDHETQCLPDNASLDTPFPFNYSKLPIFHRQFWTLMNNFHSKNHVYAVFAWKTLWSYWKLSYWNFYGVIYLEFLLQKAMKMNLCSMFHESMNPWIHVPIHYPELLRDDFGTNENNFKLGRFLRMKC